jgi:glutathione synthase/RimK-type ligase-like ATP-grasp enzyme
VVNGYDAFTLETSKALQLLLLERLGLPYPRARVVNHPSRLLSAAEGLTYPVIVKPNVGGSGALMRRFESPDELAAGAEGLDFGIDRTAIVQEYLAPAGGAIVRVEVLDGRLLYAIKIQTDPEASFNLCPADICQIEPGATGSEPSAAEGAACDFGAGAVSTPSRQGAAAREPSGRRPPGRRPLQIEPFHPPPEIVEQAIAIVRAGGLDVGGVEYLVAERDGRHYFYDVNALSNFVTDAPSMLGFDPTARFVDYLLVRARAGAAVGVAV